MKTKVSILALLLFATTLLATKQPLRYKLKVGDEYHYKMTAITDSTSEYQEWLSFKVLSKTKDNYQLHLIFQRKKQQQGKKVFDTQGFDMPDNPLEKIDKHLIGKKIKFSLSSSGAITNVDISEEFKRQIFKEANITGILEKKFALEMSSMRLEYINDIIQSIFQKLPEKNLDKWTDIIIATKYSPKAEITYMKSEVNNKETHLEFHSKIINHDTIQVTDLTRMLPVSGISSGRGIVDSYNSLLLKKSITSKRESIIYNEGAAPVNFLQHSDIVIEKVDSPNSSSTIIIAGEVEAGVQLDSIKFFIWNSFPDKDIFRHTLNKDANNHFYLKANLPREMEVAHDYKRGQYISHSNNLLLEPGDSIYFKIGSDWRFQFFGKGSFKIKLYNKISRNRNDILVDLEPESALETALDNIEKKFAIIDCEKGSLSEWAFNHLKTGVYFSEYASLINYYYMKSNRKVNPQMFSLLFSEINFEKYTSSTSFYFRYFINSYIFRKQLILHGYKENIHSPEPESYMLSKMLLKDELQYYTLAYYVFEGMKTPDKSNYESIYNDFQALYKGTEYAKSLQSIYENRVDMSKGSFAPDFTLKTLDGKKVSLSDYKGKWVMVSFCEINYDRYKKNVLAYQKMVKELPSEDFELLIAFSQSNKAETEAFLKQHNIKGVLLDNHGWRNRDTKKYQIERIDSNFLINPEGEIEFSGSGSPRDYFIQNFIDYIRDTTLDKKQQAFISKEALIGLLSALLLLIALFWGIYKWRIRIIKKGEKQEREKLKLEMQAVRSQLNPHFLFNSMNSIQHLVNSEDNEKANLFLSKFGALMRKVLNQSELNLIPLKDELETIATYMELEALRHKFIFNIEVDTNIDLYTVEVPSMLLQPFVENAVIHGINGNKDGRIVVKALRKNQKITIQIIDNGNGLRQSSSTLSNGLGLQITQKRIDLMMRNFKNDISFKLKDRSESETGQNGVIAEITFNIES